MTIDQYIDSINRRFKLGNATEHTFRGDLERLIEELVPDVRATNEPKRQTCGAPDFILTKKDIPVGFIEAKDIGDKDLDGTKKTGNKEQFDRYKASLGNLIFTDYLDFHLYREGVFITKVSIGEISNGGITAKPGSFTAFTNLIKDFCTHVSQTIRSSKKLAEMMAGKARLLSDVIEQALTSDEDKHENSTLKEQMEAFKQILIHDITPKDFADVYAQTIAYGMFAARLHDPTLPTFSRQEAAELIPKSNPFLRKLFGYIAGPDLDDRIKWIVDSLIEIFLASNVEELLQDFGKNTKTEDPIIHFYETFLSEYDPKLRKARGVWYTPQPVVNFIVRAVDDILKSEFNLPQGLADTSKIKIKKKAIKKATADTRSKLQEVDIEEEVHRVQILDPATGTGTFLAETVKHIHKKFEGQAGIWSSYVENHLLPRLNGFELLMASYAMAHLKMDLLLTETGYKPTKEQRFRIFLTNSLEESHPDTGTLFASWLSDEANQANRIKRDTPVMCVIGNPPYSGESANKGEWIMKLMEDYKMEPGGKEKLKEQNSKFINDDYVKFIRYGQHYIEKNGSGILAFINPHGYLDNPTFRGMRWNLLKIYDKIYTVDLHGNAKKKEVNPEGGQDQNVFDIEQGVSINIFVKSGKKKTDDLGEVFHFDLFGMRKNKYDFLEEKTLNNIIFKRFTPTGNSYQFKKTDNSLWAKYNSGINPIELFTLNVMGFQTHRDDFCTDNSKEKLIDRLDEFAKSQESETLISQRFGVKNSSDFQIKDAQIKISKINLDQELIQCNYRPFEKRYILFDKVVVDRPRKELINHTKNRNNISLGIGRQGMAVGDLQWGLVTIADSPMDANMFRRGGVNIFSLYLYAENSLHTHSLQRTPNFNMTIIKKIMHDLNYAFAEDDNILLDLSPEVDGYFSPIDVLDYIYAVLHSPQYREKYKEFLKIDFPRIPYPQHKEEFERLKELGKELRQIHLLEAPIVEKYITKYPVDGDNKVGKPMFISDAPESKTGSVFINDTQHFSGVPLVAWNFYIGGYQPAQKWLKDRKDRVLEFEDILHYQKIIVALSETARLMEEIGEVE